MGVLARFKDIMSANINAMLDKAEDPEKMIDQCLRNLQSDLGEVKSETAAVMAQQNRCKRELDDCDAEIKKLQNFAIKALEANEEEDARKFLEKKGSLADKRASLQQAYDVAETNANNMRAMHEKLTANVKELESKRADIKSKLAAAKTQEKINNMMSSADSANRSIGAFERMEDKANAALDKAQAMAELNTPKKDEVDDLMDKYNSKPSSSSVDSELEALKASLNK